MSLTVGSTAVPYGDTFQFTRKLSDSCDWSLNVREDARELEPDASSSYAGVFDENAYSSDGLTYAKLLSTSGTMSDGTAWTLPTGVPDSYSYQVRAGDLDAAFTWRGKGIASKLYRPHLSLASIISNSGSLKRVQDVLAYIFSAYGIACDVSGVEPNYVVPRMQLQDGSPIEWVRQLLEVTQAEWYEDGSTIVCFQPSWSGTGYDWSYTTSEVSLREVSTQVSAVVDFSNYITCQRADDTGGVVGSAEKQNATFGRQGLVTFSTPVPLLKLHWRTKLEVGGFLSDFYIYGPDGPPARPIDCRVNRGAAPPLQSGDVAHSVEFTFGALVGQVGVTAGSYSIEFRGDTSGGVYEDNVTSLVVQNSASIASGRGTIKSTLGPNPLIADSTTLQTWGERVLYKRSRKAMRISASLWPANYDMKPGDAVRIVDVQKGTTYRIIVQSVNHTLTADEVQRTTTFEGVQYV